VKARQAVLACVGELREVLGDRLSWVTHPATHQWSRLSDRTPDPHQWLPEFADGVGYQLTYQGGASAATASDSRVEVLAAPGWKQAVTFLHFCIPLDAVDADQLAALMFGFADRLGALSGYAGVGLVESWGTGRVAHEPTVFALTQRYPGLIVDRPISHALYLAEAVMPAAWLTVLGDRWVDQLGGATAVSSRLGEGYQVDSYDGGLLVRAGVGPELGEKASAQLAALAALLAPIRVHGHRGLHEADTPDRLGLANTEAWLGRFEHTRGGRY
jgi:hypothetical protein